MALLVALPATAGTAVVAAHGRPLCESRFGAREQRGRFPVAGQCGEASSCQRRPGAPLTEGDAVAQQLPELNRARDRIGKGRRQRGQLLLRHDAAEVVEAMEAERQALRIRRFEREAIGERLGRVADAVLALEQRAGGAPDRDVLGFVKLDAGVLQRLEQLAGA